MGIVTGFELYVDGVRVFHSDSAFDVMIEDDGFVDETGMAVGSYTYEEGEYLGWAINEGDTTPDFVVGDEIAVGAIINIYSIPAQSTSGKMYIGTSTISKMYIGQDEVEKIYFGQDLVYEKQASALNVHIMGYYENFGYYKLNDGSETKIPIENFVNKNTPLTLAVMQQNSLALNNVTKLEAYSDGGDAGNSIDIYNSQGILMGSYGDSPMSEYLDITSYLTEGCYVVVVGDD